MNDYTVFHVRQRDPYTLVEMGSYRANNGHGVRVSPLGTVDLVAYPQWAASRAHYPGFPGAAVAS